MIRVAFCCHGNICRSTLSESVFTYKTTGGKGYAGIQEFTGEN